jgi:hypothetical protein
MLMRWMCIRRGFIIVLLGIPACSSSGPSGEMANGTGGAAAMGAAGATGGGGGSAGFAGVAGSGGAPAGAGSGGANASGAAGVDGTGGAGIGGAGASGSDGSAAAGGASGADGSANTGDAGSGASTLTVSASWPNGAILTGVRDVTSDAVTQTLNVHNGGLAATTVSAVTLAGPNSAAFQINGAPQLPATLAAGADLAITVQVMTSGNALPPAPAQNSGGTLLLGTLRVTAGLASASAEANLFGLILTTATHEVTLGQILTALGYRLNVGLAQNNANPNTGTVQQLPKIESGTDEIAAPLFRRGSMGNVTLLPVARFSPKGPMPFGWYPTGNPNMRNQVAQMASMPDNQTSDKARMVLPPVVGSPSFDPGTGVFGIWVYTDQLSQRFDVGGVATNGDYAYSEDAPNSPANVHRTKVYPLKDGSGVVVAGSYLLAVEEAGNGDYQDYVFVLSNVIVAQ